MFCRCKQPPFVFISVISRNCDHYIHKIYLCGFFKTVIVSKVGIAPDNYYDVHNL